jgi:hypothetical protein
MVEQISMKMLLAAAGAALTQPAVTSLPQGRLLMVSANPMAVNFIDVDASRRTGSGAEVVAYRIYLKGVPLTADKVMTQDVQQLRLSCAPRTAQQLAATGFDASGKPIIGMAGAPAQPIQANDAFDFMAKFMCDGATYPKSHLVVGHAAAKALAKRAAETR